MRRPHHLKVASTLPDQAGIRDAADRAIKALRCYIASGFDNPYKLRHDPRLEPLRKREDSQKMVRELEEKVKMEEIKNEENFHKHREANRNLTGREDDFPTPGTHLFWAGPG